MCFQYFFVLENRKLFSRTIPNSWLYTFKYSIILIEEGRGKLSFKKYLRKYLLSLNLYFSFLCIDILRGIKKKVYNIILLLISLNRMILF